MPEFESVEDAVKALEAKDGELAKLQAKNQELIGEKRKVQEQLRAFGDISAEDAKRLKGVEDELNTKAKSVDERLTALRKEFDDKLAAKDTEIAGLTEDLEGATIKTSALAAINDRKANAYILQPLIEKQTRLDVIDGKRVPVVLDEAGKPRTSPNAKTVGEPMTIGELVEEMSKDERLAGAFPGTGSSGGGATNDRGGAGSTTVVGASELTKPSLDQLKAQEAGTLGVDLTR